MTLKKLILSNRQSPGDLVMLTAAVRDLHRSHPGKFATDVRTSCPALWENNPHLTPVRDDDAEAVRIECHYPLIHRSNSGPWHFVHGFTQFLAEKLGVEITPTDFKGDIHLAPQERKWISQVQEITREPVPFWIVNAGGKFDFTAKWWELARYQAVVDHFRGRILFVQVGEKGHRHPPLRGVLDLRGRTSLRQLVRLVHHAQGVLCPVTLAMHLAAAVPLRDGMPKNRPCVVIAGGREPAQWEAYPHHQFIHTNGALRCCDHGGCWKSRTIPLGDGDKKDVPDKLCTNVVHLRDPALSYLRGPKDPVPPHAAADAPGRDAEDFLPRCLDLITAEEVIRRISLYFDGGAVRHLTARESQICRETIADLADADHPPEGDHFR
ncbi:MAG: glycosyltransferase family 9 protein [Chthoniobacteraceae bacterium]